MSSFSIIDQNTGKFISLNADIKSGIVNVIDKDTGDIIRLDLELPEGIITLIDQNTGKFVDINYDVPSGILYITDQNTGKLVEINLSNAEGQYYYTDKNTGRLIQADLGTNLVYLLNGTPIIKPSSEPETDTLNPSPETLYQTTLFSADLEARITTGLGATRVGSARSTTSKSSGKFYFEATAPIDNVPSAAFVGIGESTLTPQQASVYTNLIGFTNAPPTQLYRARLAVDIDAGKFWYANQVSGAWSGDGNPEQGINPDKTFTPNTAINIFVRPYKKTDSYGVLEARILLHLGADEFFYEAPNGFVKWTK